MADKKKSLSSSSVLVQLYNNRKLATKVDNMLDEGQTYDYIIEFCKENGLSISKASLTNYKKKREESIRTGVPLIHLLDKRTKDNVTYITQKEVEAFQKRKKEKRGSGISSNSTGSGSGSGSASDSDSSLSKVEKLYNDLEFLDEIIAKGMKGLKAFDVVDTPLAMKAVELKAKLTNNQLAGLSIAGLRELKLRQTARESAITEIIMKYVPEEKHDQLFKDLEEAEQRFYENLDLTEEGRRIKQAFDAAGIDL